MNKKKYLYLDILRCFAIVGVVTIHVTSYYASKYNYNTSWWLANFLRTFSKVSVPIFVMISGSIFLNREMDDIWVFYKKRLARIGTPYIIWTIIYFVWMHYWAGQVYTFRSVRYNILDSSISTHLYFLPLILGLYIITPALRNLWKHSKDSEKKIYIAIAIVLTLADVGIRTWAADPRLKNELNIFTRFIPYIGYYLIGAYFGTKIIKKPTKKVLFFLVFAALGVATLLHYYFMISGFSKLKAKYFIANLSPIIMLASSSIFLLARNMKCKIYPKKLRAALTSFAKSTFGIYLVHPIFVRILSDPEINGRLIEILRWHSVIMILKILVVVAISYLLVTLTSKIPVIKSIWGES